MSKYIHVQHVCKSYQIGAETIHALKDISFYITSQEIISIVGASGAGKSTLLHVLGALDRPSSGNVSYNGTDIFTLNDTELALFRNTHIGFVFQFHHLLPEFTALENVMMPLLIRRIAKSEAREQAYSALQDVGLDARIQHKPGELSGGEQQRVAIARAIVNNPTVIFADEPTGNLDTKTGNMVSDVLQHLNEKIGVMIVLVTHNEDLARIADRVVHLSDGDIMEIEQEA